MAQGRIHSARAGSIKGASKRQRRLGNGRTVGSGAVIDVAEV